ncbi:MAG: hypothetical protein IKU04_07275 [Bacteroidales bacterium]|nr:hypothetical protein [Bacteroidales bacterium]
MRKTILSLLSALCLLALNVSAQDFEASIRENIDRFAGVYHSYEYIPTADTPAPKGYKPFYVSHYGRHGSRHQIGSSGTRPYETIQKAEEAGLLTEEGKKLAADMLRIYTEHEGMDGELSVRGGREHAAIAARMQARFPDVFKSRTRTRVHCQASTVPRCLLSMSNFTGSLKHSAPNLLFDYITGDKYLDLLAHDYFQEDDYSDRKSYLNDSIVRANVDPSRVMKTYFKDDPEVEEVIPNPWTFMRYLFLYAAICQDLEYELGGLDIKHYLTEEELMGLAITYNERTYGSYGNSLDFGDRITWAAKWLVEDFIARADAAIEARSNVAADLRFGHDSGIMPLAGLLGLEGVSARYPMGQAYKNGYFIWERVPMGTNLQMVFYRDRKDNILVKVLYNEKETAIPAVPAFSGPYYRWEDLKAYLVRISEDKSDPV